MAVRVTVTVTVKERGDFSCVYSNKSTNSEMRTSHPRPNYLPNASSPNTIAFVFSASTYEVLGDTNNQSIALPVNQGE